MRTLLYLGLLVTPLSPLHASAPVFWMPAIFGDHMVLQAGQNLEVWGRDAPGTRVTVAVAGMAAQARADAQGNWAAHLRALPAGGPYTLDVEGSAPRVIKDVLVGEVWLGSGQSNMELALRATQDRDADIPKADDPTLRLFTVDRVASLKPLDDLIGHWEVCTPKTAADFSAVAFYFGRELQKALHKPVGLIAASWGGTPGEDWVSRAALDAHQPFQALAASWDKEKGRLDLWSKGMDYQLQIKDLRLGKRDGSGMPLPVDTWTTNEKPGSTGSVRVEQGVLSYEGLIQGSAWGSAAVALRSPTDPNTGLDVRPYDTIEFKARGQGSFTTALGQATVLDSDDFASSPLVVGPDWQEHRIAIHDLKQGGWGEPRAFSPQSVTKLAFVVQVPFWPDLGGVAYNGMIAPLTRFRLAGVLWYQGESNAGRADHYGALLKLLVQQWRQAWDRPDLPFLTVQLPGYGEASLDPGNTEWAALRQGQAEAMAALAHTGLAVTIDLGERDNIHPRNKKPVGKRLALLALARVYGHAVEDSGPQPTGMALDGDGLLVSFSHARGLALDAVDPQGFEVAGLYGKFHPANAGLEGGRLRLWSKAVPAPNAARYAWANDPRPHLFNGQGLPAAPFI